MDHQEFLRTLSADERAHLTGLSDAKGFIHLIGHLVLLAASGSYIAFSLPFWQVALVPHGIVLVFLFTLEHECTHRTPFKTKWINDLVGRLCGLVLILPFEWFRYFHLAHHKHTNNPDLDPELQSPRPQTSAQLAWYISGLPYWDSMILQLFKNANSQLSSDWIPTGAVKRIVLEARVMLMAYACACASLFFSDVLVWLWMVPSILAQPFLRLYLLAEHGRCAFVANMFENTRTTFTNTLVRYLAWNMPYHAEHHVYPAVPFWKLPRLHKLTMDHLVETSDGYAEFTAEFCKAINKSDV